MNRTVAAMMVLLVLSAGCTLERPGERENAADVEEVEIATGETTYLREGFSTPESATYDPEQDVYFISNINGAPTARDNNGYITRVDAETGAILPKWIDGMNSDTTLHAPCGISLTGDALVVADAAAGMVRWFGRTTGESLDTVAIPDSIFVNDVFALPDGTVYVSDLGMAGKTEGLEAEAVDAVYRISPDREVEKIASGQHLNQPDGVWVVDGEVWIAAFGSAEVYRLEGGEKADVMMLPTGVLDGLMLLQNGALLVSSWDGNGIYYGTPGDGFELIVGGINSPADFGFDSKRNLLIVPHLEESIVSVHPFSPPRQHGGTP